jgi:hypothetical protein
MVEVLKTLKIKNKDLITGLVHTAMSNNVDSFLFLIDK